MFSLNPEELTIIAVALALGGFFKGVTGVGLPLIAVPMLATFVGVEQAVLVMVLPSFALNLYQVWTHRRAAREFPEVWRIVVSGIPGAALGASVLYLASERFLASLLALWIFAYVIFRFVRPVFSLPLAARLRWSPVVGASAGALQAATGISAPVIAAYTDSLGLRPEAYVFAVCAAFGAFAGAHLGLVAVSGVYTADLLARSVVAIVPALVCVPVGAWARRLMSQTVFDWVIRFTLVTMAVRLLYTAWAAPAGN